MGFGPIGLKSIESGFTGIVGTMKPGMMQNYWYCCGHAL